MQSLELAKEICDFLVSKKAHDVVRIEVSEMTVITDYFVICSAKSMTAVKALYENLEEHLSKKGVQALRRDGANGSKWIAVDFGGVIVHIFLEETREIYHLDRLWGNDTNGVKIED